MDSNVLKLNRLDGVAILAYVFVHEALLET